MKTSKEAIAYYGWIQLMFPSSGMLREIKGQYIDMARGGTGGSLGFTGADAFGDDCEFPTKQVHSREFNYPYKPDSYFQEVCDALGWDWLVPT